MHAVIHARETLPLPAARAAGLLGLLLVSCGSGQEPGPGSSAAPPTALQEVATGQALELAPIPRASEPQYPPELASSMAARSAGDDDWSSEVFAQRVGVHLKAIEGFLTGDEPAGDSLFADWTADELSCDALWWPGDEPAEPLDGASVRRPAAPQGGPTQGRAEFARALLALRGDARGAQLSDVHFKVVGVDETPGARRLRAYYQASGERAGRLLGQRASWEFSWSDDEAPRLVALGVSDFSETLGRSDGALFGEISAAALGDTRAWREQLTVGLETWAGRIDRSLGVSLIGHQGLAVGDVDSDGLEDLYVTQAAGLPNLLFLRRPGGAAVERAGAAGVDYLDGSRAPLLVDLDGDDHLDLALDLDPWFVLHAGDGAAQFEGRLQLLAPSTASLSAADYDLDGDLDLYLCGYLEPDRRESSPLPYHDARNGKPNRLLRNDCGPAGWAFEDVTEAVGLDVNNRRFSLAASWEDYDDDGDLDLYVANDFGRNNLYRNDGGRFSDVAAEAGVEDMAAGMGVSWGDYDRDGDLDLYVSNMFSSAGERVTYQRRFKAGEESEVRDAFKRHARGNSLFENQGDGRFRDVSREAGVLVGRWAWGSVFCDLDGDGWRDLFVPNGFVTGSDPEDL